MNTMEQRNAKAKAATRHGTPSRFVDIKLQPHGQSQDGRQASNNKSVQLNWSLISDPSKVPASRQQIYEQTCILRHNIAFHILLKVLCCPCVLLHTNLSISGFLIELSKFDICFWLSIKTWIKTSYLYIAIFLEYFKDKCVYQWIWFSNSLIYIYN